MIIKYILGIILGWIIGSIVIVVTTTLRFGIPMCNKLIKNKEEDEACLKKLRKKYCYTLIIWLPIIILATFLSYNFLGNAFGAYLTVVIFMFLIGFGQTGTTENNLSDFYNSLKCQGAILKDPKDEIISEFQKESGLSREICSNIYDILILFNQFQKSTAYSVIENTLIPNLIKENNIGNVGIAFGMLINDLGLSKEEANNYSQEIIKEMLSINNSEVEEE